MFKKFKLPQDDTTNVPFILIVLVSGVLAYTKPDHITIDLFCLLLISIVLDTFHFFLVSKKIEMVIEPVPSKVQKAQQLEVIIKVKNNSFWPTPCLHIFPIDGYRLNLKEKQNYCLFLGSGSVKELALVYEAQLSGKQTVGFEDVFLKDYLGLYRRTITLPDNPKIKVLPEVREGLEVDEFLGAGTEIGYSRGSQNRAKLGGEGEVAEDLTAYKAGDSPKLLHWKILAQKNQLLVRQRETGKQDRESVLLILSPIGSHIEEERLRYELQDRSLTASLSLSYQLVAKGHQVAFMYYQKGNWIKASLKYAREIQYLREKLASYEQLESSKDRTYRGALRAFLKGIEKEQGLKIVVAQDIDQAVLYYLDAWRKKPEDIKLLCVGKTINKTSTVDIEAWQVTKDYELKKL
ncbi:DUF58 domain-containing protein [Cellulosilyticum lentocellum]|uniref:Uncharacterized protein n=1 Tax=Cellulosilyticum lentocellum (strain ATCC 49066 / DSM 5427 / NCIMB 11756 / RHM5) TaxID=642492 RepID=F2JHW1_CELLD|nr:DUF58 domain-containing protein [Cellulosilyticum lentocellum]ADZ81905.1 protein of unknown function DUF58 [Cellulosilyticum lentocellum DSM 5427]